LDNINTVQISPFTFTVDKPFDFIKDFDSSMNSTTEKMAMAQELSVNSKECHAPVVDVEDTVIGQSYASPSSSEEKRLLWKIDLRYGITEVYT
jgi:hypothetical protein